MKYYVEVEIVFEAHSGEAAMKTAQAALKARGFVLFEVTGVKDEHAKVEEEDAG